MSLWKKGKDLFKRMTGQAADTPPPVRPDPTPPVLPIFAAPLPKWKQDQRDFAARAKETRLLWNSAPVAAGGQGTQKRGVNAHKRKMVALREKLHGSAGGWKKIVRMVTINRALAARTTGAA